MSGTKQINHKQKMEWTPIVMERDYPGLKYEECTCIYCHQLFHENSKTLCREWEHLNDNKTDNRPENMAWAHAICNEEKQTNFDWKLIALDKLKENVRWAQQNDPAREGERAWEFSAHKQTSNEADVAAVLYKHAVQFLAHELLPQNGNKPKRESISLKEAAECVDYRTKKETGGSGSQSAAQRHLETLSCTISEEYERRNVNGKQIIFRRIGQ